VEIYSLARVTDTPVFEKVKFQGHTDRLNIRIDVMLFHFTVHGIRRRSAVGPKDPWKNRICSTTMKLRKSLVNPVTRPKTCNYNVLFGYSAQDHHARCIYRRTFRE